MTQVDHSLTRVNVLDSVISTSDANLKHEASHLLSMGALLLSSQRLSFM
jgi:hypothetical protein